MWQGLIHASGNLETCLDVRFQIYQKNFSVGLPLTLFDFKYISQSIFLCLLKQNLGFVLCIVFHALSPFVNSDLCFSSDNLQNFSEV